MRVHAVRGAEVERRVEIKKSIKAVKRIEVERG